MTKRSIWLRHLTPAQRAAWHWNNQLRMGHYIPTATPRRTYRAQRRNVLRAHRLLHA